MNGACVGHATRRWVAAVQAVWAAADDVPTVHAWARQVGMSERKLRAICECVGESAKNSLDFARGLRLVRYNLIGQPGEALAVEDIRTLRRFIERSGLAAVEGEPRTEVALDRYLGVQGFVRSESCLSAMRSALLSVAK